MRRIKLLKKDKDKWVEYDIFSCPRCKYMQFRKHWNCIGVCHSFCSFILDLGRYDIDHSMADRCHKWSLGKFKSPKKKVVVRRKTIGKSTKVRKVLPR